MHPGAERLGDLEMSRARETTPARRLRRCAQPRERAVDSTRFRRIGRQRDEPAYMTSPRRGRDEGRTPPLTGEGSIPRTQKKQRKNEALAGAQRHAQRGARSVQRTSPPSRPSASPSVRSCTLGHRAASVGVSVGADIGHHGIGHFSGCCVPWLPRRGRRTRLWAHRAQDPPLTHIARPSRWPAARCVSGLSLLGASSWRVPRGPLGFDQPL